MNTSVPEKIDKYCQAQVRSPKVQSPKVKTKRTWADTIITWDFGFSDLVWTGSDLVTCWDGGLGLGLGLDIFLEFEQKTIYIHRKGFKKSTENSILFFYF